MLNKVKLLFMMMVSVLVLAACGDPGGMGNTVTVTASAKDDEATLLLVDDDDSAATTLGKQFSYTLTSTPYTGVTGKGVNITSVTFTYSFLDGPAGTSLASFTSLNSVASYAMAIRLESGGDADYDNVPVLLATPVFAGGAPTGSYTVQVTARFHGEEDTGKSITTNPVSTNIIITNN